VYLSFGNTAALNAQAGGRLMDVPIEPDDQKVWQFCLDPVSAPEKLGKSGTEKEYRINSVSIFSWPGLQINKTSLYPLSNLTPRMAICPVL